MENKDHKELQLLPSPPSITSPSPSSSSSMRLRTNHQLDGPSLDLQLSISPKPVRRPRVENSSFCDIDHDIKAEACCVETLKLQAAEQIRLASIEKAYAERMRELTRREIQLAQSDFGRARLMWERAKEEVDKVERIKERATTRNMDSTCMEITCQSCCQRFPA